MFIRHLVGPRKGEVEDVIFDRARAKVIAGEAADEYNQLAVPPTPLAIVGKPDVDAGQNLPSPHVPVSRDAAPGIRTEPSGKKKSRR